MCKDYILTDDQRKLVESELKTVEWAIYNHIDINSSTVGLAHDDLYQEGCLALCRAAATYDGSTQFRTYAQVVVRNALLNYCRKNVARHRRTKSFDMPASGVWGYTLADTIPDDRMPDESLSQSDTLKLLESMKSGYSGVALKGIEALELKIKGFSGSEIAAMYGVKPTHVGAWISRAAKKLRSNERFLQAIV